jgi:hypothetical protein
VEAERVPGLDDRRADRGVMDADDDALAVGHRD